MALIYVLIVWPFCQVYLMPFNHYLPGSCHGYLRYQEMKVYKKSCLLSHFYTFKYSSTQALLLSSLNTQLYKSHILISPIQGVEKFFFFFLMQQVILTFWGVFLYQFKTFAWKKYSRSKQTKYSGLWKLSWTKYKWRNKSSIEL